MIISTTVCCLQRERECIYGSSSSCTKTTAPPVVVEIPIQNFVFSQRECWRWYTFPLGCSPVLLAPLLFWNTKDKPKPTALYFVVVVVRIAAVNRTVTTFLRTWSSSREHVTSYQQFFLIINASWVLRIARVFVIINAKNHPSMQPTLAELDAATEDPILCHLSSTKHFKYHIFCCVQAKSKN